MAPSKRSAKKHAKARARCRLKARQRLDRDRAQAQRVPNVLEQALHDSGLPEDLVAEIEGRLRGQQKLLGKIFGVMLPPSLAVARTPTPRRLVGSAGAGQLDLLQVWAIDSAGWCAPGG
jgi:hypothetical protein